MNPIVPCETLPPVPKWWLEYGHNQALNVTKPREIDILEQQMPVWAERFANDKEYLFPVVESDPLAQPWTTEQEFEILFPCRSMWRTGGVLLFFKTLMRKAESIVNGAMKSTMRTTVVGEPKSIYGKWTLLEWDRRVDGILLKLRCEISVNLV